MLILWALCTLWLVSLFYGLSHSRVRALSDAGVALAAMGLHLRCRKTLLPLGGFFQSRAKGFPGTCLGCWD